MKKSMFRGFVLANCIWAGVFALPARATVTLTEAPSHPYGGQFEVNGGDCKFTNGQWRDSKYKRCEPPAAVVYTTAEVAALIAEAEKRIESRILAESRSQGKAAQKAQAADDARARGQDERISRLEQSVVESLDHFEQRVLNDRFVQLLREQLRGESPVRSR